MSESSIVFPGGGVGTSNPGFSRFETLVTIDEFKKVMLHGIDFRDDTGNEPAPEFYDSVLRAAISTVEHILQIPITPVQFIEYHDYHFSDYQNYCFMQLYHHPVLSVDAFEAEFIKGQTLIGFPLEWVRLYPHSGQLHLTPTVGSLSTYMLQNSGLLPRLFGTKVEFPQLFKITYTAGFEQDKIPSAINRMIMLQAGINLLTIAGEFVLGAGIASQHITIDGLSQSVNSTASAMYNAFAGRISMHEKELAMLKDLMKKYYNGINCFVS